MKYLTRYSTTFLVFICKSNIKFVQGPYKFILVLIYKKDNMIVECL